MPSRRRKKPSSPGARRTITPKPVRPWVSDEQLAADVRKTFTSLAVEWGRSFGGDQEYVGIGAPGECWTNAWFYSRAHGLAYAEGVAAMPDGWHAHAWCVDDQGRVVEPTRNYQHATEYRGWVLNREGEAAIATLLDDEPRSSFLESGIGSGVAAWEDILTRFCTTIP